MNIGPFLNCLAYNGLNTGAAIFGLYSMSSGDNLIVYNQLYPTGNHYIGGIPYSDALPLIYNGYNGQLSGIFTTSGFYQISNTFVNDFSTVIYLNYSGCLNTGNLNYLLVSTSTGSSGVNLGITPSNRVFIQTPDYSYTIPKEIGIGDFVYFSVLSKRYVNFGLFSMEDNILYSNNYDEGFNSLNVQDLYFGGTLNYPTYFTGYSGKINEIYLFSGALTNNSVTNCVNCAFATGYGYTSIPYPFNTIQITGSYWSTIQSNQITGTSQILSSYPELSGGTGYVYIDSGLTGNVTTNQALIPLVLSGSGIDYGSGISFLYNNAQKMSGILFDFYFPNSLSSGDIVEIYTYSGFNNNIGFSINNFQYPSSSQIIQLYGNGLAETSGVDYYVAFNNLIIGFDTLDIIQYDVYPNTYTMPYTTGYIQTGITGSNYVIVTGASGITISGFNYDIYLNGQKMASGINYSYSGNQITVSGNDLLDINDQSGDYLEIKFIPIYSQVITNTFEIIQNQSYISGLSGFSEQIWLNGLRQTENIDYLKLPRCRFCSGIFNNPNYSFGLYDTINNNLNSGMIFTQYQNILLDVGGNVILDVNGYPILTN